jgi:hypothetical protein
VGGVSGRLACRKEGAILPPPCARVTVKGIPAPGKPALFAGRRRKGGLGRSALIAGGSSSDDGRTGDSGCPLDAEEGNVVGMRIARHMHSAQAR